MQNTIYWQTLVVWISVGDGNLLRRRSMEAPASMTAAAEAGVFLTVMKASMQPAADGPLILGRTTSATLNLRTT